MWGAIIGAAGGLAGSLIGGHNAKKQARRQMAIYKNQLKEARAKQLRYANEDYSQSAGAQAALAQARELQEEQMQNARGADAVSGGNSVPGALQASADAQAKVAGSLAQSGYNAQRQADQYYGGQASQAEGAMAGVYGNRAQQSSAAGSQALQAGLGLASADINSTQNTGHGIFYNMFGFKDKQEDEEEKGS